MLDDHRDFARIHKWRQMNGLEDRKHSSGAGHLARLAAALRLIAKHSHQLASAPTRNPT